MQLSCKFLIYAARVVENFNCLSKDKTTMLKTNFISTFLCKKKTGVFTICGRQCSGRSRKELKQGNDVNAASRVNMTRVIVIAIINNY